MARRGRNRITTIVDDNGEWLLENEVIKQHATTFFSALYTSEIVVFRPYLIRGCFPNLNVSSTQGLTAPIEDDEIQQTIFSMKPLKAPGVDGLHAIFYQSQWHIIGPSFCRFIQSTFNSGIIPKEINTMLLVLIPKVDHPVNLKMYHPISLCTVVYKTISKIVANRLQALMPNLIGPQQTSFVLGRHIIDNIVIA